MPSCFWVLWPTLFSRSVPPFWAFANLGRKFQEMIAVEQDLVTKGLNPKSEKELLAFLQERRAESLPKVGEVSVW